MNENWSSYTDFESDSFWKRRLTWIWECPFQIIFIALHVLFHNFSPLLVLLPLLYDVNTCKNYSSIWTANWNNNMSVYDPFGTKERPEQDSNLELCNVDAGLHQLSYQASWDLGHLPFTPSIRVEILGVNIQCCSFSKCKMGRSENVLVSIGKFKRKRKNASINSIAYNFWNVSNGLVLYVPFHFPTRISGFSVKMVIAPGHYVGQWWAHR